MLVLFLGLLYLCPFLTRCSMLEHLYKTPDQSMVRTRVVRVRMRVKKKKVVVLAIINKYIFATHLTH